MQLSQQSRKKRWLRCGTVKQDGDQALDYSIFDKVEVAILRPGARWQGL